MKASKLGFIPSVVSTHQRLGLWVNSALLGLVIVSALALVRWQYESRRLHVLLEKSEAAGRQMALDNASISAQKRQLSAHARTARIAAQQLKMKTADATVTIYLGGQR